MRTEKMVFRTKNLIRATMILIAAFFVFASPAQASLIGDDVEIEFFHFLSGSLSETVTVGAGPEIEGTGVGGSTIAGFLFPGESIDIAGDVITLSFGAAIFFDISFNDLQWQDIPGEIIALPEISGQSGLGSSSFTSDSVSLGSLSLDGAGTVVINFTDAVLHDTGSPVPEPSALGLFALGLLGIGVTVARRRRGLTEA